MTQSSARAKCIIGCLALLLTASCSQDASPASSRTIILGFDGMDPQLASQWMDQGILPNFKKLADEGHFQSLATSNPPQSPVAWSGFATGTEPGDHGIYDFLRRDAQHYAPDFSISETRPPEHFLDLFGLHLPLDEGEIINRRIGTPFWQSFEERGQRASVLRVPVTFPPDDIYRMLAGMGVPDLLGTQGTYSLYTTSRVAASGTSSRVVRIRPHRDGSIHTRLEGPADPVRENGEALNIPLLIKPAGSGVSVELAGQEFSLQPGQWSDLVRVSFQVLGPIKVSGLVRLHLVQGYPKPRLYVSPIQIDPRAPAVPLSSPPHYSAELAETIGDYHTIGMPEETWSLNENHISDQAYLDMTRTILGEREAMFFDTLDKRDSELLIGVFVQTDRVSHMFYRGLDPQHPLHEQTDETVRNAIRWIYQQADRILGQTMARLGAQDRLIVISDHGFAPFRQSLNLNRWLIDEGFLVLKPGKKTSEVVFADVDWSQSRAYALGLNGVFVNRTGREASGIVGDSQASQVKEEISDGLLALRDRQDQPVIRRVFDGAKLYAGNANGDAPDLVIGYHRGYRASWQTALGGAPGNLLEPNGQKWSGDHCIDPYLVPGVLFTSFKPEQHIAGIADISKLVLEN
jgi:predicted AlkP superfamily phosphohydrolase/phosphomutase